MEIGIVGLGKMGGQIAEKLNKSEFKVFGYDQDENISKSGTFSFEIAKSLDDLSCKFQGRKIIWVMVPSGTPTDKTIATLIELLDEGDVIIDGGNSFYKDSINNSKKCEEKNIEFLDCGTSGGVWGLENGFCLTIGGKKETYSELSKLFNTLSTPESPNGLYVGVAGAGHYVKMIHNGIEYGMMQSIAEGFEILKKKEEFNLNLYEISQNWRSGSVIQSWLIDLITYELKNDTNLSKFSSMVSDSGEGRWTIKESIDLSVPIPSIYASISQRFNSKNKDSFSGKILSAMRNAFGGHKD
ncbi:MAG: 6-phosphogluconate dehydrogenase (decarboxylating) [Dehalococcoidia bacterium]|nr:6-phosphogluconate dehydrogenase (decarboxylating) [Dehalococcoidia bacterium]|tara:strand:+ start:4113 stop:5006 length:894 start_codon:yes stop_codon:yes gene_type:complete